MKLRALPPVRRAAPMTTGRFCGDRSIADYFGKRQATLFTSGTAALYTAIRDCAARAAVGAPEVMLPAYGCPDLVAACAYASVFPRLVDISPGAWGYCQDGLERHVNSNTIAIIAVNLLGVGDDAAALHAFCRSKGIALIQDSAQHLPRNDIDWPGEYVVLSFGRGKPLNLLCGGALFTATQYARTDSVATHRFPLKSRVFSSRLSAAAFNVLTQPIPYRFLSVLPGTGLGAVRYKPLGSASPLPDAFIQRVSAAFELYCRVPSYQRRLWEPVLNEWHQWGIEELRPITGGTEPEPLRLALLAPDRGSREALVNTLARAGLGATRLYGTVLSEISGVPDSVRAQGPFPNASRLASRLLTLPTHTLVSPAAVHEAHAIVRNWHCKRAASE